jgi:imidazolonepropionase-like amidohydrolase
MRRLQSVLVLCLSLGAVFLTTALEPAVRGQAAQPGLVAIRNATLLTVSHGTIANGTVILRDGKIAAAGANLAIPAGAEVVDATGKFVTPGLIDCHSHIANDAINEGSTAVSAMTGMFDVLDPTDINIYRDLAGGTTTSNILHGSSNPIGGKTVVIKLRWGKTRREDMLFDGALPGIKFALGENVKRPTADNNAARRFPATRQGVEYVIRDAFTRAKAYQKARQEYEKKKGAGADALAPRPDLQLDALVEVLEGKRLVHAHGYRADELLMLIRLADEMGFKIATFQHVLEGYKIAKEIAAHGAGASTFSDWWGYKIEAEDAIPHNAALMVKKGVLVSINSDDAEMARRLNMEAAKTVRYGGLTDDEALALVTINPAKQLKIDNRVGSIDVGKDADVTIWDRHPLSSSALVERTYIDGVAYYDRVKDLQRAADLETERRGRITAGNAQPAAAQRGRGAFPVPQAQPEPLRVPTNADGPAWAITNARIVTVSGPVIERGTVVIRGNRIEAVGARVSVPSGARVVDATGSTIYPGMIDAGVDLGINEPGVRNYDDITEILPFGQMLRTRMAYQSDSDAIPITRAEGITTIAVRSGVGGTGRPAPVIAGDFPVMNLDGWTWEENTLRPTAGFAMTFPSTGGRGGGGGGGGAPAANTPTPAQRIAELDALLQRARAYATENGSRQHDWTLEPFLPIFDGRQAVYVAASTETTIREAVAWAEKAGVRMVLITGADAQRVAPLLRERNIPVILTNLLALPPREDDFHAYIYQTPSVLAKAGVLFAFSSGTFEFSRNVPFQAARAVGWGLDRDEAIKALTLNAAKILGVDSLVGAIERGKLANLVVVKGDPLEIRSQIQHVVIAGRDVPLETKHTELFKRYLSRK